MATLSPQVSCPSERKAPPAPPPTPFVLKPRVAYRGFFFWIGVEGLGRSANRKDCLIRWSSDFPASSGMCHAQEQIARDERNPLEEEAQLLLLVEGLDGSSRTSSHE